MKIQAQNTPTIMHTTVCIIIGVFCEVVFCEVWFTHVLQSMNKTIPFEYWIERVTLGLLYVIFRFSTKVLNMGVPGFATDCPCGVWCRGLPLASCTLVNFLEIYFEMVVGL